MQFLKKKKLGTGFVRYGFAAISHYAVGAHPKQGFVATPYQFWKPVPNNSEVCPYQYCITTFFTQPGRVLVMMCLSI